MSQSYKGLTIPAYADPADAPQAFQNFVNSGPIPRFSDATARDAAITTPIEGQMCFNINTGIIEKYDGSAWVPASNAPAFLRGERITTGQTGTATVALQIIYNNVLIEDDPYGFISLNTSTGDVTLGDGVYMITAGARFEDTASARPVDLWISYTGTGASQQVRNSVANLDFHTDSNSGMSIAASMLCRVPLGGGTVRAYVFSDEIALPLDFGSTTFITVARLGESGS